MFQQAGYKVTVEDKDDLRLNPDPAGNSLITKITTINISWKE